MRAPLVLAALAGLFALGPATAAPAADWWVPGDFPTLQAALDDTRVVAGDVIHVDAGSRAGATVTKAVEIRGHGAVIVDGPRPWASRPDWRAGIFFPGGGLGSGATVRGLRFQGVQFPVYSRGADDVSVLHCRLRFPIQGITSWGGGGYGNDWTVVGNRIVGLRTDCAGGIGVLIGEYAGGTVSDGLVAHNVIRGRLRPSEDDCGGYAGSGVVVYADFRYGSEGASAIRGIRISKNRVALRSTAPDLVDVVAIELTDSRGDGSLAPVIVDNEIVYNDLRGSVNALALTPAELAAVNRIEHNLTAPGLDIDPDRQALSSMAEPGPAGRARPVR